MSHPPQTSQTPQPLQTPQTPCLINSLPFPFPQPPVSTLPTYLPPSASCFVDKYPPSFIPGKSKFKYLYPSQHRGLKPRTLWFRVSGAIMTSCAIGIVLICLTCSSRYLSTYNAEYEANEALEPKLQVENMQMTTSPLVYGYCSSYPVYLFWNSLLMSCVFNFVIVCVGGYVRARDFVVANCRGETMVIPNEGFGGLSGVGISSRHGRGSSPPQFNHPTLRRDEDDDRTARVHTGSSHPHFAVVLSPLPPAPNRSEVPVLNPLRQSARPPSKPNHNTLFAPPSSSPQSNVRDDDNDLLSSNSITRSFALARVH